MASINQEVPALGRSALRPSPAQLLWIVDAYVVLFACLVIPLLVTHWHHSISSLFTADAGGPARVTALIGLVAGALVTLTGTAPRSE